MIYEGTEALGDLWVASKERNQFVWVPVEDLNRIYDENTTTKKIKAKLYDFTASGRTTLSNSDQDTKREPGIPLYSHTRYFLNYENDGYMQGYNQDTFYKETEIDYKNTIKSIKKYKGFYIGRYETGAISTNTPVVKRMNTDIGRQTWYTVYPRMKNISNNPNIHTSMIWGSLFDETLEWLIETGNKARVEISTDSTSWGNYNRSSFTYKNINGNEVIKNSSNSSSSGGIIIPAGSTEYTKANNIYDLAGNVWDWTREQTGYEFIMNGGYCNWWYYTAAKYDWSSGSNGRNSDTYGFRAFFYIK